MSLHHRVNLFLVTTVVLLAIICHHQDSAMPAPAESKTEICQFFCTKDPPEGGNFCNCDRHPLGKRSVDEVRHI